MKLAVAAFLLLAVANAEQLDAQVDFSSRYKGCYRDTTNRAMTNQKDFFNAMTLDKCYDHCARLGKKYCGAQASFQCFCADSEAEYAKYGKLDDRACSEKCQGDGSGPCGGQWMNSVYVIGIDNECPTYMSPYIGGYGGYAFDLRGFGVITKIEWGTSWELYISRLGTKEKYERVVLGSHTHHPCPPVDLWPGKFINKAVVLTQQVTAFNNAPLINGIKLYDNDGKEYSCITPDAYSPQGTVTATLVKPPAEDYALIGMRGKSGSVIDGIQLQFQDQHCVGAAPPSFHLQGCYNDLSNRAMTNQKNFGAAMTLKKCNDYCLGLGKSFFGAQASFECFCADSEKEYARYGKINDLACFDKCQGDGSKPCGGRWTNSVYATEARFQEKGCYRDTPNRAMTNQRDYHGAMTLKKCNAHCAALRKSYFGAQASFQCFCADRPAEFARYGKLDDGACSEKCQGDGSKPCGGQWKNSVYVTKLFPSASSSTWASFTTFGDAFSSRVSPAAMAGVAAFAILAFVAWRSCAGTSKGVGEGDTTLTERAPLLL